MQSTKLPSPAAAASMTVTSPHSVLAFAPAPTAAAAAVITFSRSTSFAGEGGHVYFETLKAADGREIELSNQLGKGAFGVVMRGKSQGGTNYAVKDTTTKAQEIARHEAAMLDRVSGHKHVLSYKGKIETKAKCYVLTDLCEGGSLHQRINAGAFHGRTEEIRRVFLQIVSAVRHCHQNNVAHRDLKPENILAIDKRGKNYCLADFGLATERNLCAVKITGTFAYMAPEVMGSEYWRKTYNPRAADVWSLGIVLLKMITRRLPWERALGTESNGDQFYRNYLCDRDFIGDYMELADGFVPLLQRILEPTPEERISLDDLEAEIRACERFSWYNAVIEQPVVKPISISVATRRDGVAQVAVRAGVKLERVSKKKGFAEFWRRFVDHI